MNEHHLLHLITFFLFILSSYHVSATTMENPFTPRASAIRYWNNRIYKVPRPGFLIEKASPLTASDSARFTQLAATNSLSTQLTTFCHLANLLCFPDPATNLEKHSPDKNFATYSAQNFTNYATVAAGGTNDFKNYSVSENEPLNSFRRYSRDSADHNDGFTSYADGGNVISETFATYGAGATGGVGKFTSYSKDVNVPGMQFTSYSDESNGRVNSFGSYSDSDNAGDQGFANYGKNGNGAANAFVGYGKDSNVVGSTFNGYSVTGNGGNENFTSYGVNGNVPKNEFNRYGDGDNAGVESFSKYRDESNVGDDGFTSYGENSNIERVKFSRYGDSFNVGSDNFTGYGEGAKGQKVGFETYGQNSNFKAYAKKGVNFADYRNETSTSTVSGSLVKGKMGKNKWVEPGKFFRESELREGNVMPMPDIRDKMPKRSFLPRGILTKLPFSSARLGELKEVFRGFENSSMEKMLRSGVEECERAPSPGETKKCVGSVEDMIDFAVSVLGVSVEPRTTESVKGSKGNVLIGKVSGINGGKVTKSVSCHQSLFPYLLYYCHSVPKVRVYQADILDTKTMSKINHGIAICHLDTSVWSPTHGAFLALGSGPGKIEVCHWIFENDLTWTIAD